VVGRSSLPADRTRGRAEASSSAPAFRAVNIMRILSGGREPRERMDLMESENGADQKRIISRVTWLPQIPDAPVEAIVCCLYPKCPNHEVGPGSEMNRKSVMTPGSRRESRLGVDYRAFPGRYAIGYMPNDRCRFADTAKIFRRIFAMDVKPLSLLEPGCDHCRSASLGSLISDAFGNCRPTLATDGFTIWAPHRRLATRIV